MLDLADITYLIPFLIAAGLSLGMALYTWSYRHMPGAWPFIIFAVAQSINTVAYALEVLAPTIEGKILWDDIQWVLQLGGAFVIARFVVEFTDNNRLVKRWVWWLLLGTTVLLSIIVFIYSDALRTNAVLEPRGPFNVLVYDFNNLTYLLTGYIYLMLLPAWGWLGWLLINPAHHNRRQIFAIFIGFGLPVLAGLLAATGFTFVFQRDLVPFASAVGTVFITWGLLRQQIFSVIPIAYDVIIRGISDAVLVLDQENRVLDMNPAAAKLFHTQPAHVSGKPIIASPMQDFWITLQKHITPQTFSLLTEISIQTGGENNYFDLNVSPLYGRNGHLLGRVLVLHDITDRKRQEAALRTARDDAEQQTAQLTALNEIGRLVSFTADLQTTLDLVGKLMLELFQASDAVLAVIPMAQLDNSNPEEVLCVSHISTIPGRNLAIGSRSKLTTYGRKVIRDNQVVAATLDQDDPITGAIYETMTSLGINSIMGVPLRTRAGVVGLISLGAPQKNQFSPSDASLAETIASQISGAIENARLIDRLQEAREQAETANRAKSAFLANMSHELRTPLNAILGFSQIVVRNADLPEEELARLQIINQSGEHLLMLINDILEISKIEAGQQSVVHSTFNLPAMLDELVSMFMVRAEGKNLYLRRQPTANLPQFITTDERKLRQILINLLGNAVKFTQHGGVTLHANPVQAEADCPPEQITIRFAVEDTGPGIPAADLPHLFKPFVQASSVQTGTEGSGLGLAISLQFARMLNGNLAVQSREGAGSRFEATIPVTVSPDQLPDQEAGNPYRDVIGLAPNQRVHRILVVDDNLVNRKLLMNLLQPIGFHLTEALDGEQAVALFKSWHPDLILMDMRMPRMDGYEATSRIRQEAAGRAVTIIAVTASVFEEDRQAIMAAGCDEMIRKPFNDADIFESIERHLGVSYLYKQTPSAPSPASLTPLTTAELRLLPPHILSHLHRLASRGEIKGTRSIIETIQATHPRIAAKLAALMEDYDFEGLIALLPSQTA